MKILYILPEEYGVQYHGGASTYIAYLSHYLHNKGHTITIASPAKVYRKYYDKGIVIYKIPVTYFISRSIRRKFNILYRILPPDIIHRILWSYNCYQFLINKGPYNIVEAPEWGSSSLLFRLLLPKQKVVVRLHGSWLHYLQFNHLPVKFTEKLLYLFELWSIATASIVTSPSYYMRSKYQNILVKIFFRNLNIQIIPNGFNKPQNISSKPVHNRKFILCTSRLEAGKGQLELIHQFKKIHDIFQNIDLLFIGRDTKMFYNGKYYSYKILLQKEIYRLKLSDSVYILHERGIRILGAYYEQCYFAVHPSTGAENYPMCILEAISYGKAVIAPRKGGVPEFIQHKINGLLYDSSDLNGLYKSMVYLMKNSRLHENIQLNNIQYAETINVSRTGRISLEMYNRLIHH